MKRVSAVAIGLLVSAQPALAQSVDDFYNVVTSPHTVNVLRIVSVPEPAAWVLLATGLCMLAFVARLRGKRSA
jgi:PEP-CTERM motif